MNRRDVAALAFRLIGLYFALGFLSALQGLLTDWHYFPTDQRAQSVMLTMLSGGVSLATGILIWISADSLSLRVFPESGSAGAVAESGRPLEGVMPIALSIIGFWLAVHAIISLLYWAAIFLFGSYSNTSVMGNTVDLSSRNMERLFDVRAKATMVSDLAKLIVGIVLMAGKDKAASAVNRLRGVFSFPAVNETENVENESNVPKDAS